MSAIQLPKSVTELIRLISKHGKRSLLVSGVDPSADKAAIGKIIIDITGVDSLNEILQNKDKISIGTSINLGRLAREAVGENGLLRQAASIIANPLVRNKITFLQALDPNSLYFDITTPLVLLDSKVKL